jgi:hypothetical protein
MANSPTVRAGINSAFRIERFPVEDQRWLRGLSQKWFLTNSGKSYSAGPSAHYDWLLAKPADELATLFGIEREVLFLIVPYNKFEPRVLLALEDITRNLEEFRIEPSLRIVLIDDQKGAETASDLIKSKPEYPSVIAIDRRSAHPNSICDQIFEGVRKSYRLRDIFGYSGAIDADLYFFGRRAIVHDIAKEFFENNPTGLFGIRRSGKTSVVNGIKRLLKSQHAIVTITDCQSPSFYTADWVSAIANVCRNLRRDVGRSVAGFDAGAFTSADVQRLFEQEVHDSYIHAKKKKLMLVFDEIERISPRTADTAEWRSGIDFLNFWRTIRSAWQGSCAGKFNVLVVGTSPVIFEEYRLNGSDNPLYGAGKVFYLRPFDFETTLEMTNVIGRAVGLRFPPDVVARIHNESGGIPFLSRQICSIIHHAESGLRPAVINLPKFEGANRSFKEKSAGIMEQMLGIIRDLYQTEFDILSALAAGEVDTFLSYARDIPGALKHLEGFGLIERDGEEYAFRIDAVRDYLVRSGAARKVNPSPDEQRQEVNARANRLEIGLRRAIGLSLLLRHGKQKASEILRVALPEERRSRLPADAVEQLRDGRDATLFLKDIIQFMQKNWGDYQHFFSDPKDLVFFRLEEINKMRIHAHAKSLGSEDFLRLRGHFDSLEAQLENGIGKF